MNNYRCPKSVNPLDINYDPDSDGWFDRQISDVPASQGFGRADNSQNILRSGS